MRTGSLIPQNNNVAPCPTSMEWYVILNYLILAKELPMNSAGIASIIAGVRCEIITLVLSVKKNWEWLSK